MSKTSMKMARQNALSKGELRDLINATKDRYEKFVIVGLSHTGMRRAEFHHMRDSWVKWQRKEIKIPQEERGWSPKTEAGARTIFMINSRIERELEWFFDEHHRVIGKWKDDSSIYRIVRRVAERTDITKKVYPHGLRATFARRIIQEGATNPLTLMHVMGWSNYKVAKNYIQAEGVTARKQLKKVRDKNSFL